MDDEYDYDNYIEDPNPDDLNEDEEAIEIENMFYEAEDYIRSDPT
jgi:hypothetical protein